MSSAAIPYAIISTPANFQCNLECVRGVPCLRCFLQPSRASSMKRFVSAQMLHGRLPLSLCSQMTPCFSGTSNLKLISASCADVCVSRSRSSKNWG